jgi:hypothetical protein
VPKRFQFFALATRTEQPASIVEVLAIETWRAKKEPAMGKLLRRFTPFLLATAISLPMFCGGCAAHVSVYDPYYHDHHVWAAEQPYYSQWEVSTHRDHVDFAKRTPADQKEYWDYRHGQH